MSPSDVIVTNRDFSDNYNGEEITASRRKNFNLVWFNMALAQHRYLRSLSQFGNLMRYLNFCTIEGSRSTRGRGKLNDIREGIKLRL